MNRYVPSNSNLALSRDEVRRIDEIAIQQYGIPGIVLMENAGRGAAEHLIDIVDDQPCFILCGKGNNAGDGYVIARHLQLLGGNPEIIQLADPAGLRGDAATNWQICQRAAIPTTVVTLQNETSELRKVQQAGYLVDAILGTGARGAPQDRFARFIEAANQASAVRIAIDIPTGLDCDSGITSKPCFQAAYTLTFVARKKGCALPSAEPFVGKTHVIPIGIPVDLLRRYTDGFAVQSNASGENAR